jgi:hypothetical protein
VHADAYFLAPSGPFIALLALYGPGLRLGPLDGSTLTQTLMSGLGQFELEHQPAIAAAPSQPAASPGSRPSPRHRMT